MFRPKTGSEFNALQSRLSAEKKAPLRYMLFDVPQLQGEDLHNAPLIERKARLEALLKKPRNPLLGGEGPATSCAEGDPRRQNTREPCR